MLRRIAYILVLLTGCPDWGSVPPPLPLTESYLADPTNCWATAAAQLAACMPARAMPAKLSADPSFYRSLCVFPDGVAVRFEEQLPVDAPRAGLFTFDIDTCGRFSGQMGSDGRFTGNRTDDFSVASQTEASIAIYPNDRYELACLDLTAPGSVTYATTPETIDTWPADILPNFQLSIDANVIAFTLDSVGAEGPLFTCMP